MIYYPHDNIIFQGMLMMDKPKLVKRTRDGCWTCRRRKKKCDARHPSCQNCEARGLQCEGYATKLLWPESDTRIGMSRRGPPKGARNAPSSVSEDSCQRKRKSNSSVLSTRSDVFTSPALSATSITSPRPTSDRHEKYDTKLCDMEEIYSDQKYRDRSNDTWALTQTLSPHPIKLTHNQTILFEHYVTDFSTIYPTYIGDSNPFLSVFANLAVRNETVLCALLALSGTRIGRVGGSEMKQEILRLKGYALKGCQRLLMGHPIGGIRLLEGINSNNVTTKSEDDLVLVVTIMLLILHDKLSGEAHDSLRPHLEFLNRFFDTKMRRNICLPIASGDSSFEGPITGFCESEDEITETWSNEYRFLHSEFLYNDLLVAMASGRPTLSKYNVAQDKLLGSRRGNERSSKFYFPNLISRIVNFDGEVSIDAFDKWDGRLDWMPSFCYNRSGYSSGGGSSSHSNKQDSQIMSEIYRAAGKVFFLQRLRIS
ncbi:hypothetical protein ONS95_012157 [Cadophora gregata]|uniref:uncharacterized protein n=1 Tax=Cadophora gregata TaxID=51156 RepID=UPI0026DBFF50|nr:uncharacterized protein ONS95_012157 [Cadophora gregata]KAK0117834.1 hypothetical protein ONS95_012157 [Cadophora gregata]